MDCEDSVISAGMPVRHSKFLQCFMVICILQNPKIVCGLVNLKGGQHRIYFKKWFLPKSKTFEFFLKITRLTAVTFEKRHAKDSVLSYRKKSPSKIYDFLVISRSG